MPRTTALVTGASSGIGEAIARQLAARGHDLVVVARDIARLTRLGRDLEAAHGTTVEVLPADLRAADHLASAEARTASATQPIDILVNCAGYTTSGNFVDQPLADAIGQIEVNVTALVRLTHAALSVMVPRRSGAVLNVSSIAGFQSAPKDATYVATKAFVTVFTESVHEEVAGLGVRVTCLCPGFTRTEFQQRAGVSYDRLPSLAWMDAATVAAAGLDALERNLALCVPGPVNKLLAGASHVFPRGAVRRAVAQARDHM